MVVYCENHTLNSSERRYRLLTIKFENVKLLKKHVISFHILEEHSALLKIQFFF